MDGMGKYSRLDHLSSERCAKFHAFLLATQALREAFVWCLSNCTNRGRIFRRICRHGDNQRQVNTHLSEIKGIHLWIHCQLTNLAFCLRELRYFAWILLKNIALERNIYIQCVYNACVCIECMCMYTYMHILYRRIYCVNKRTMITHCHFCNSSCHGHLFLCLITL